MTTLLADCIRDILGKLQVLAHGATLNLDPNRVTENGAKSKAPPGTAFAGGEPEKDKVSLYEFYRWQFEHHADDPQMLRTLWMLAYDDYEDFRFKADHRIELRKGELLDNDPRDGGAAERAQGERVVSWYEGKPPLYVAMIESKMGALVTEAWVKKVRLQNDRDPLTGRARAEFRGWDEERRRREVERLAREGEGRGAKAIAAKLGVDKNTVKRYLAQVPAAA